MPNLSALSNVPTTALGLSNLILVSADQKIGYQPQSKIESNGELPNFPQKFLFEYEGENTVSLNSDITDHFVEDNTTISDQIALRPEIIKVNGFVGELNNRTPEVLEAVKKVANKLSVVGAYTPALSTTALLAYNNAFQLYQAQATLRRAANQAWTGQNQVGQPGNSNQTLQQIGFSFFYAYWRARILFKVQTPWALFDNMAIQSINAIQSAETNMISDFEITFKKIRFAETLTTTDIIDAQGRLFNQKSGVVNLGTNTPVETINILEKLETTA